MLAEGCLEIVQNLFPIPHSTLTKLIFSQEIRNKSKKAIGYGTVYAKNRKATGLIDGTQIPASIV